MLELLCGPIASVMAQMTDRTSAGSFRTLAIALQFASGAVGSLVGSYDTAYAYPQTHALEVSGTRGRLLIEDTVRRYTFSPHDSETAEVWQAGYFNDGDRSFYATFDKHVDALLAAFKAGAAAARPRPGRTTRAGAGPGLDRVVPHGPPGRDRHGQLPAAQAPPVASPPPNP